MDDLRGHEVSTRNLTRGRKQGNGCGFRSRAMCKNRRALIFVVCDVFRVWIKEKLRHKTTILCKDINCITRSDYKSEYFPFVDDEWNAAHI